MNKRNQISTLKTLNNITLDRRSSTRICCSIPIEFTIHYTDNKPIEFTAYILNLSKNGLYLEYIDSKQYDDIQAWSLIDPDVTKICFHLPNTPYIIKTKGRIINKCISNGQIGMGIEFEELDIESEGILDSFIKGRWTSERG